MNYPSKNSIRVLAIDLSARGFGFAIMEGSDLLIDWAFVSAKPDKNRNCLKKIAVLMNQYDPEAIVVEEYRPDDSRRSPRTQKLAQQIRTLALERTIQFHSLSRSTIEKAFSQHSARTKHAIATVIAQLLPELAPRLPKQREIGMNEDDRMNIFDAVALALTFFFVVNGRK